MIEWSLGSHQCQDCYSNGRGATNYEVLCQNGGHIQLTIAWSYPGLCATILYTKTKTSLSKPEFELAKECYLKKREQSQMVHLVNLALN